MATFNFDHIHYRTPDPEGMATFFEKMFGAQVIRTTVDGKPRIDLKLDGTDIFLAPVAVRRRRQCSADDALSGPRPYRADGEEPRRGR